MGNQEAKQRRANGSCVSVEEGWREGDKKSGKHGVRGVHGTAAGKKKNKTDAKSSVFSLRKRKGHLKGKGDAGLGSKDDILSWQQVAVDTKTPDLSADELGQSDTESALSGKKAKGEARQDLQQTSATSDNGASKDAGHSGSDTDIHSFHSADDHDDLLADIQRLIQLQHQQQTGEMDPQKEEVWKMTLVGGEEMKETSPPELLGFTPELEVGSDALSFLEVASESEQRESTIQHLPLLTEKSQEGDEETKEEEESNWESESSLCITTGTKDQHAFSQEPDTSGGAAVIPVTIATDLDSFLHLPGEEDERETETELLAKAPEEPSGISTSSESLDDHVCPKVEASRSSPSCRRHGSPLTHPRSTNSSSSSPVVKPYPPIIPSYIKTTTRQLSSPGHSPICSPFHSPLTPLRAQHHLFRWVLFTFTADLEGNQIKYINT